MTLPALLHPFAPPARTELINIARGKGAEVWDQNGKGYIDGLASLWYVNVGHCHPEMISAINEQVRQLSGYHIFDTFTNPPAEALAQQIREKSPMPDSRVFLANSGSEAVDTAFKLARLTQNLAGHPEKTLIVSRDRSYHGTNLGGTSAQGIQLNREGWGPLLEEVIQVPADSIEALTILFAERGDQIAAVVSEPVQGAGGVYPPPLGYLTTLAKLCKQHGALLILDEVITGFGRLGNWFGAQNYGITPDLLIFAKGVTSGYVPLSGVIVGPKVRASLEADPTYVLRTGYTYSGHPLACAAGLANLVILEEEGLLDRALQLQDCFAPGLARMEADGLITNARGEGGMWAVDMLPGVDAVAVRQKMVERGVIVRPIGNSIAICPPLVITDPQVDQLLTTLTDVLSQA